MQRFCKPTDPQPNSLFFEKLPAELRNKIYAFIHTYERKSLCNNHEHGQFCDISNHTILGYMTVDLKAMTIPRNNHAFTCQRLHTESRRFYKAAYRNYWRFPRVYWNFWRDNEFVIQIHDSGPSNAALHNLDDTALALVTKLEIELCHYNHRGGLHAAIYISKTAKSNGNLLLETPDLLSTESPVNSTKPIFKLDGASNPRLAFSMNLMKTHFHSDSWMQVMMNLRALNESRTLDSVVLHKFLRGFAPAGLWDSMPEPKLEPRV